MSEAYGLSTLPLIEKADQNLSLYSLQTNLLKIWTEKKVDKYYQTAVLAYLDNLSENQAKQEIIREQERLIQNKSQFNKIQQYVRHRQEVLDIIEQMLEDEQQLEDACQSLDELRKINLKLCECIFQMKESLQSRGLNGNSICQGYNQMFKNLETDNVNILQSYLKKHIPFGKGYDPFFLVPYERVQKQNMEDIPKCVAKLFKMNISYVYRLIKAKNQIIKCLSCSCVSQDDKIGNDGPLVPRPKIQKQSKSDHNNYHNQDDSGLKHNGQKQAKYDQKPQDRGVDKSTQKQAEVKSKNIEEPDHSQMVQNYGYIKSKFSKIGDQSQIDEPPVVTKARQIEEKNKNKLDKKAPVKLPQISKSTEKKPSIKNSGSRLTIKKNRLQTSPNLNPTHKQESQEDEIDAYRKKIILRKMKKSSKNIEKTDGQKEKKKSITGKGGSIKKQTPRNFSRNGQSEEEDEIIKDKNREKRKGSKRAETITIDVDRKKDGNKASLKSQQSEQGNMSSQIEPLYLKKSGAYQSDSNYRQRKLNPTKKQRINTQQRMNDPRPKDKDFDVWNYDNRNSKPYQSEYSPHSLNKDNRRNSKDSQSPHQIHHRYGIHNPQYCQQCRMDEQDNQYRKNRSHGKGYQNQGNYRQGELEDNRYRNNYGGNYNQDPRYQNDRYSPRLNINGYNRGYQNERNRNYPYDHNYNDRGPLNNKPQYGDGHYNSPYYNSNPNNSNNRNSYRQMNNQNQPYQSRGFNREYPDSPYNSYENDNPRNRSFDDGDRSGNKNMTNDSRNPNYYQGNQSGMNPYKDTNNNMNNNRSSNIHEMERNNNDQRNRNNSGGLNPYNNLSKNRNSNSNGEEIQRNPTQNSNTSNMTNKNRQQNNLNSNQNQSSDHPNQNLQPERKSNQNNQNIEDANQKPNSNNKTTANNPQNSNQPIQKSIEGKPPQNTNQANQKPIQKSIQGRPPQNTNQANQKPNQNQSNLNTTQNNQNPKQTNLNGAKQEKNSNGSNPTLNQGQNNVSQGKLENKSSSPQKQGKKTNPAQTEKSSPTKRQIQMKPGQIKVNDLFKFISQQKIPQQYRSDFQIKLWKENITNRHSYMTKFFLNSQLAAFGISSPRNDGDYSILYWGVMVNNDKIGTSFLFKRYLEYLQKFTSLNNIYINSSKYENMEFVQQGNNYVKKRSLFEKKQLGWVPFLSIQCSNICFNQSGDINHSTFFSEEIQNFSIQKSLTSKQVGLIQRSQKLPSKMKIHENVPSILEINKLLQKYEADTYAATEQIKTGPCKLIVLKDTLAIKSNDFYVRDGFFMTNGLLIHSQSSNDGKPRVVYKMELQKNNIHVFFGKNFPQIQQFTKNCNYKSQGSVKNFAFKMFTKQLYGRMKNPDFKNNGCYGNWDIDFVWQDQLKGVVIKQMPSNDSVFGPENFFVSIFKDSLLLYGFQVNSNDFVF